MPEAALPPDLKLAQEIMSPAEEVELIAFMEGEGLVQFAFDPNNPRSSKSYGWKYDFHSDRFLPCDALPANLRTVAARAADVAGLAPEDFAECLLNRYDDGAIIQSHLDKEVWDHVVGVSLGVPTTMVFRHSETGEERPITLQPRSVYVLQGASRYVWEHALPPIKGTRWSITFRKFSAEGLRRLEECPAEI